MQRESWEDLGFAEEQIKEVESLEIPKQREGRVAGLRN